MKKELTASDLKIKKMPMLQHGKKKAKRGPRGMGYNQFIAALFKLNEKLPKRDKMTDAEIARQIRMEFRKFDTITHRFREDKHREDDEVTLSNIVSQIRSDYNRGVLTASIAPPSPDEVSFCYDENGNAVNPRYVKPKALTEKEKDEIRLKFQKYRDKWEKERS